MNKEKHISFTFNFNAPVGQNIAHVDKIEAHFDKDMTMQVVDTKGLVEAPQVDFKERNNETETECNLYISSKIVYNCIT